MKIYFTRHGLVNYTDASLSEAGQQYAEELHSLLPDGIKHIVCDLEERCIQTIFPISIKRGLSISKISKNDFINGQVMKDILAGGDCLVCYRIESVNAVFQRLNLPLFTNANRDEAYETILVFDNKDKNLSKINTGYRKGQEG